MSNLPSDTPPINGSTVSFNSSDDTKKTRNASPDPAHIEKTHDANSPPVIGQGAELVPKEVEKKLMRKLDLRIIPWAMWMYLMSFMDRVNIGNARIYGLEDDLGITGTNKYQLSVSILFVTYCVSCQVIDFILPLPEANVSSVVRSTIQRCAQTISTCKMARRAHFLLGIGRYILRMG